MATRINLSTIPRSYTVALTREITGDTDPQKIGMIWSDLEPVFVDRYNPTGDLKISRNIEAISQSLKNILSTRKGQLVHEPSFGCSLEDRLFEPMTIPNAQFIGSLVQEAILKWENRVDIVGINVFPNPEENRYDVDVSFKIRSLEDKVFNLETSVSR